MTADTALIEQVVGTTTVALRNFITAIVGWRSCSFWRPNLPPGW
jgi:hypothetical protein